MKIDRTLMSLIVMTSIGVPFITNSVKMLVTLSNRSRIGKTDSNYSCVKGFVLT